MVAHAFVVPPYLVHRAAGFLCSGIVTLVSSAEQPDNKNLLLVTQPAPKPKKGKFVRIFNELSLLWHPTKSVALKKVQGHPEEGGHGRQGVASGNVVPLFPASNGGPAPSNEIRKGFLG